MRRPYIDWLRGVAVLAMMEWHVLDSWSMRAGRETLTWRVIQDIGGYAAPLFLFLAGLAAPMAIAARHQRGASLGEAAWSVQKRGWQILAIAHLFRATSFLFNPAAPLTVLLTPDVLNILGLGLIGTAWLSGRALRAHHGWWIVVPALVVLALTPMSRTWAWPEALLPEFEAYIRPGQNAAAFSLFPWAAYVPLGGFVGFLLVNANDERRERQLLVRLAAIGLAVIAASLTAVYWPAPYTPISGTITVADVVFKTGWMMTALAVSRWLVSLQPASAVAPLVLFGQTSLFVYWVHVEFAYGVWSLPLHGALPLRWSLLALAAMILAMYFAARWWRSRPTVPARRSS